MLELVDQLILQGSPYKSKKALLKIRDFLVQAPAEEWRDRKSLIHLSASALVFVGEKLYFVQHPYLHQALLPAGHVEAGEQPDETALREFTEETGFVLEPLDKLELVDLNIFSIPANPAKAEGAHHHVDFRYRLEGNLVQETAAELPWQLLTKEEAPEEFQIYYS